MVVKCSACGKFLRGGSGVVCPKCQSCSHYECVRLVEGAKVPSTWRCGDCQMRTPKGRDPMTPVRVTQVYAHDFPPRSRIEEHPGSIRDATQDYSLVPPSTVESMVLDQTAHDITAEFHEEELQLAEKEDRTMAESLLFEFRKMQEQMSTDMRALYDEMNNFRCEIREARLEMGELRASLVGVSTRVEVLERRLDVMEKENTQRQQSPDVAGLQAAVSMLQHELADRDQEALLADLEVGHLPEESGESPVQAITILATKLGVQIEPRDVVYAERVGALQRAGAAGETPPARRLVVRLARRDLRDQLLAAARVRRTLTTADAGRPAAAGKHARIYINERLTRANRVLFARARELARRQQWRYVWTKRGRVNVRQADGKQAFQIRSQSDLDRIFAVGSV